MGEMIFFQKPAKTGFLPVSIHLFSDVEELSSPITSQMFDFSDQGLYPDAFRCSDVSSSCSGGYCYDDNSYGPDPTFSSFSSLPPDIGKLTTTTTNNNNSTTANGCINNTTNNNNNNHLSILFDPQQEADTDLSASLNSILSSPPTGAAFSLPSYISNQHDQLELFSLQSQILFSDPVNPNGLSPYSPDSVMGLAPQMSLPAVLDEDCLCPLPPYICMDPSSPSSGSFIDQQPGMVVGGYMGAGNLNGGMSVEAPGMFSGGVVMDSGLQSHELEFQGENGGVYSSDSVYSSGELQGLNENQQQQQQQLVGASGGAPLTSDISTFEESAYKVGRLSVEERKEKIHRYMKKRNERNFTKKIKYACRKTLADSRPRVRGRFAKNDDFGEVTRPSGSNHEDDEDEEVGVKEEEEMMDSADIFAHISGVNSFKCNYPIQSWI
ncbi:hypothetical protein AAC387_Pa01g4001 [Persea americana]